ncbi:MAG: hypothetical protein LAO51_16910 [Acidobacteriia bacterium]|nr:hypothetical protein [Terriglobia bacterium]
MPEQDGSAALLAPTVEETTLDYGLGRTGPAEVTRLRVLGRGRAAHAVLVDLRTPEGSRKVVEKHFVPAGLTRAVYKVFFGAPFPYGLDEDAALSCLYRRHVAGALLAAEEGCRVAEALYVRRCNAGHWVLGTEWIEGRPVAPPRPHSGPEGGGAPREMRGLLRQMRAMEKCLLRSGLVGSGWQVATAAIVSTANLLRNAGGEFVCVDLESGIPAVLAPRYVFLALTGQPFPMFDDLDEKRLLAYLESSHERLRSALGTDGLARVEASAERLIHHSRLWKRRELAPGRHRTSLLFDRDLRTTVRSALADRWRAEGRLDERAAARLGGSRLLFLHPLVLLGMVPTPLGKLIQRVAGHRAFRARFFRALLHPRVLDAEFRGYQERRAAVFLKEHRIPAAGIGRLTRGLRSLFPFMIHDVSAAILPARLHRYLADWRELGSAIQVALLALVSERIQEHLAYSFVEGSTRRWKGLGRLDDAGRGELIGEIRGGEAPEYARGFGMHLALKFFEPLTSALKALGVGMLLVSPWNPVGLALLVNTSFFRVFITTYRWLRRQDKRTSYAVAFVISPIPVFGTLAFPFQFYHRRPWLGRFLIRSAMSSLACAIPIYGGTATRLEHGMVRLATPLTALVAVIVWPLSWLGRRSPRDGDAGSAGAPSGGREWLAPQIDRALDWLSRNEAAPDPCG